MKKGKLLIFIILITIPLYKNVCEESDILFIDINQAKLLAEDNSKELKFLALQLKVNQRVFNLGFREFLPKLKLGFTQNDSVIFDSLDTRSKQFSISLDQLVFDGGRTIMQRSLMKYQLLLNESDYKVKREEILDTTWNLFYQLYIFKEKKELQQKTHKIANEQLRISQIEWETGAITEIDLIETELEIKYLEAQIKETETEEEDILFNFKRILGIDLDMNIALETSIDKNYIGLDLPGDLDFWLSLAVDRNIEYKKIKFEIEKKVREIRIADNSFLPDITIGTTFSVSGDSYPLQDKGFTVNLSISFPFRDFPLETSFSAGLTGTRERNIGGSLSSGILEDMSYPLDRKMAIIELEMQQLSKDQLLENLSFLLAKNLKVYQQKKDSIALQRETIKLLNRKEIVMKEQLNTGEKKRIDYLKTQIELFDQETIVLEEILKLIELERSIEQAIGLEPGELQIIIQTDN